MPDISLATYSMRVHPYGSPEDHLPLSRLHDGLDLFDVLADFFEDLRKATHDVDDKRLTRVRHLKILPRARRIEGILESGEYGYEAALVNVHSGRTHRRHVKEAELLPFYFLVYVPRRPVKGVMILQRFGSFGVSSVVGRMLARDFAPTPNRIQIDSLVPDALVNHWTGARRARKIRLVSFKLPKHIEDVFRLGGSEDVYSELVITARRGKTIPLTRGLRTLLRSHDPREEGVVELQRKHPHDLVKMEVDVGGKRRTVDVRHPDAIAAYFNVTDRVEIEKNGHPSLASIRKAAYDLLGDIKPILGEKPLPGGAAADQPAVRGRKKAGTTRVQKAAGAGA